MVWVRLNLSKGQKLVASDSCFILVIQLHSIQLSFGNWVSQTKMFNINLCE